MAVVACGSYSDGMARAPIGELLREWRTRRRRSQLDLALDVGVSTRHLSFVETGRSRPSAELVLALAHHLEVPLRERNALLLAAGYAPRFSHRSLDDPSMAEVRSSIRTLLDAHLPYPGVVVDRQWNVVSANEAAMLFVADLPPHVSEPRLNVYRMSLHPDGLAARTINFTEWAAHLVRQLRRTVVLTGDPDVEALLDEVVQYPNVAHLQPLIDLGAHDEPPLLVPFRFAGPTGDLSLFTTITTFGTPRDVTLDELAIELFYPADERTAERVRALSDLRAAAAR